jgi:selenophosphate synthetase-related protein
VGASIALERIPRPDGEPQERWLTAFPSYGFLLAVDEENADAVERRFFERGVACAQIGAIDDSRVATLTLAGERATLWDFREAGFILPTPLATPIDSPT